MGSRTDRLISLDLLRAAAILLVLGRHLDPAPTEFPSLHNLTVLWNTGGWIGVDLFFVLSGFLVSGLLFREHQIHGEIRPVDFYVRRGLKIYPAFFVFILFTILVLWPRGYLEWQRAVAELFFVQNYFDGLWRHTWTLAIEEHFYLMLPLVLIAVMRKPTENPVPRLIAVFSVIAVVCLGFRLSIDPTLPFKYETHLAPTHMRIDSLFFGVVLSAVYHYRRSAFEQFALRFRTPLLLVGVACFAVPFFNPLEEVRWISHVGLTLIFLGGGALLVATVTAKPKHTWATRSLAFIGAHSYSIYLWHWAMVWVVSAGEKHLGDRWNWFLYALIYFGGALAGGIIMSKLVEFPVLRLRDRFFPSRSKQPTPEIKAEAAKPKVAPAMLEIR